MSWDRAQPLAPIATSQAKVIILVPHRDEHDYRQWRDWWHNGLQKPPGTTWLESRGLSLTTNRTQLVRLALQRDATHFFFLDDDLIAPNDVITTLLAPNLPIVCGLFMAKKKKTQRGLAAWMKRGGGYAAIAPEQAGRHVQVDATALGCVMIHRSVFERIHEPWFVWDPDSVSEDFFFFEKVFKELGIKPLIDMEMRCLHIGTFAMDTKNEFTTLEI